MRKLIGLFALLTFVGLQICFAQTREITGTVIDKHDKSPLPGVSVVVKGNPTQGVATDINGKFSLRVSDNDILVFTFIGMKTQEVSVKGKTSVTVELEAASEALDEVMVVAYGTAKKSSFTGSVASIKADAMEKLPVSSFEKALQGLSPGLQVASVSGQPGSQTQILIRGFGSMSAASTPLYVIDGVPISTINRSEVAKESTYGTTTNPLSSLNPNDIESISILKDASAASLYGSRAANGVILITTKQGSKGTAKVNFKAQVSTSKLPSGGYDLMNAAEHYGLYYGGFLRDNIESGLSASDASIKANEQTQAIYGRNPYNTPYPLDANGNLTNGSKLMIDTDWLDEAFRTGLTQEYDFSINGGNEKTKYFLSLGYLDQEGIALGSDFERYSGRANVSSELKNWFSAGINTTFAVSSQNTPVGGAGGASILTNSLYLPSTVPVYDLDLNFNKQYDANGNVLYNFKNPIYPDMNPISFSKTDIYNTKTYRVLVNPYINFKFIDGLNWKTTLSYDYMNMDETQWYNPEHGNGASVKGRLYKYAIWDITQTLTSTITYDFSIAEDHHFGALVGYEAMRNTYNRTYAQGTNFPAGGLVELNVAATPQEVGSKKDKETMVSYFGRLNYDYNNKYYLSFSLRSDGSSRFAPDNQFGTFWSIGGSWRMAQESFMKNAEWIKDLKIRASYGTSGNKASDYLYGWQGLYDGGANYNGGAGIIHGQLSNYDLSWEVSKNLNIGVDFSFWNRLSGSVEYYQKKSSKLLLEKTLAGSTGLDNIMSNLGGMKNSGLEVELKSNNISMESFTWNTDFNISYNKNEITSYPQKEEIVGTKIRTVGYSLYEFYIPEWAGVDKETGNPLWYKDVLDAENNPTGERITTSDYSLASRYKLGSSLPTVYGGLNNTFTFKGLDLSILFTYGFGGKIYDAYEAYLLSDGNNAGYQAIKEQADYWTPENKNAVNPKFIPNNSNQSNATSSRYLHDADFIKLKSINIGYTFPKRWANKIYLENIRLFASFDNLCVWNLDKDFKGYDVELGGVTGVLDGGGTIPLPQTCLFGINVSF